MKIAIAGYGVEGKASYRYWNTDNNQVVIVDEHEPADAPVDASIIVGEAAFSRLAGYDMVVRTPGLAPHKITTDGKIWSATNEFFAKCPAPIIGVTGSKGKGTTCSLIASILQAAGKTVHLVGNIGVPALDVLADVQPSDIVVYELSSFQLWDAQYSPHIAVVLMIEPDHLDVHSDMDDYVNAKANIRRHQGCIDSCYYHPTNEFSHRIAVAPTDTYQDEYCNGGAGNYFRYGIVDDDAVYVRENTFFVQKEAICSTDILRLPGSHNLENACAAISAVLALDNDISHRAIQLGLAAFSGLPHRLKFVREVHGVRYYDDSIATTPGSAIAALHSFDAPKVLILGGSDKGADFSELADEVVASESIRSVVTIGQMGGKIGQLLHDRGFGGSVSHILSADMNDIVADVAARVEPGDVVILSPACASFDMFKNYAARGDQFIAAVNGLS